MEKKVIVLPIDGYESAEALIQATDSFLSEEGLSDLVAYIKVNDGIHNMDMGGPVVIALLKNLLEERNVQIKIFLDLKIFDVSATMVNVLKKYLLFAPEILTVSASCSVSGIARLREILPLTTKLAMVSVLTDISEDECLIRFGMPPALKILNDLTGIRKVYRSSIVNNLAIKQAEPFDFVICSPKELLFLKKFLPKGYGCITPGIRDEWMKNPQEHQKRITGVKEALESGATFVVIGSQMTKGNPLIGISAQESRRLTKEQIILAK